MFSIVFILQIPSFYTQRSLDLRTVKIWPSHHHNSGCTRSWTTRSLRSRLRRHLIDVPRGPRAPRARCFATGEVRAGKIYPFPCQMRAKRRGRITWDNFYIIYCSSIYSSLYVSVIFRRIKKHQPAGLWLHSNFPMAEIVERSKSFQHFPACEAWFSIIFHTKMVKMPASWYHHRCSNTYRLRLLGELFVTERQITVNPGNIWYIYI